MYIYFYTYVYCIRIYISSIRSSSFFLYLAALYRWCAIRCCRRIVIALSCGCLGPIPSMCISLKYIKALTVKHKRAREVFLDECWRLATCFTERREDSADSARGTTYRLRDWTRERRVRAANKINMFLRTTSIGKRCDSWANALTLSTHCWDLKWDARWD